MDEDPEELAEVYQAFDGELGEGQSQGGAAAGLWLEYQLISCGTARLEPFLQVGQSLRGGDSPMGKMSMPAFVYIKLCKASRTGLST